MQQEVEPDEEIRSNVSLMNSPPPDNQHEEINYDAPAYARVDDSDNDESKHIITDVTDDAGDEKDEGGRADDDKAVDGDDKMKNGHLDDDVHDHVSQSNISGEVG